jgi:superfamily II DNA or RNA helicase
VPHLAFVPRAAGGPHLFLWDAGHGRTDAGALAPLLSDARRASAPVVAPGLSAAGADGLVFPLMPSVTLLAEVPAAEMRRLPASMAAWSLAAKLALDLVARERVVPLPRRGAGGGEARWAVALSLAEDRDRFLRLARTLPPAAHALRLDEAGAAGDGAAPPGARVWPADAVLLEFLDEVADGFVREAARGAAAAPAPGSWEGRFVAALTRSDGEPTFLGEGLLDRSRLDELIEWATPARGELARDAARLCLKLDFPAEGDTPAVPRGRRRRRRGRGRGQTQAPRPRWLLSYHLQAVDDPGLLLPAAEVWASPAPRLEWKGRTFVEPQERLLRQLGRAGRLFPAIEASLDVPNPEAALLTDGMAWDFISHSAPLLDAVGVTIVLPPELMPDGQRRLRLRMQVGEERRRGPGLVGTGHLALDQTVPYHWQAAIGDQALTPKDFAELTALRRPLVQWRGQWVVLPPAEMVEITRLLGSAGGRVPAREALAAVLNGSLPREGARPAVDVVPAGPLAALLERLRGGGRAVPVPGALRGSLRPYQERGLDWLALMASVGVGGCLADDMGLGKTVQAIAFLLARREALDGEGEGGPTLIVCPMSVVGNWERELARFAPSLPVVRHHGPGRARDPEALRRVDPHTVVVTTYALLRRDHKLLASVPWGVAILDEAQNVKNASSRQALAARSLRAAHRFAMTGTPLENRLTELWSILEYCVPGFLGPLADFRRRFAIPIERYRDDRAAARLRLLVRPFILRRLKGDVAADLPEKLEMPVVCTLTREQATLYQATVDASMAKIHSTAGIERRGLVLAMLTALKQICNHPAQYLREKGPLRGRSGKLDRVTAMLEETVAAGDRALVFTQYREMGDRLVAHLARALDEEVLYLHGGVDREARDAMVRRFQEDPNAPAIFVLSLRAGGTGVNLTRATRVIHYDRWWNPAVEDQATDRAHRIGQERVVQVFRLLAAGTLEEKIDAMLADKRALADRIVGTGETWITELSDGELRELVTLSPDAAVDDDGAGDDDGDASAPAEMVPAGRGAAPGTSRHGGGPRRRRPAATGRRR